MAYTPKTWTCGDTISAEDLNHIEQGIANSGGGTLIVSRTSREATTEECSNGGQVFTYSHSWQEIHDALEQNQTVLYKSILDDGHASGVFLYPVIGAKLDGMGGHQCLYLYGIQYGYADVSSLSFTDATSKSYIACESGSE